jgi:hypothetical protein
MGANLEGLIADAEESGRLDVRIAVLRWLGTHIWWHFGTAFGMGVGALAMAFSPESIWAWCLFWGAFSAHRFRSDYERAQLLRLCRAKEQE